jgi:hypothetical protein
MNMGLANNQLALSVFQLQGKSLELHKEQAALDEPAVNAMREGGVKPLGPEVGETEMKDLLAKDPSATTKRWLATGVKQWIDPSGKVQYELKFTPYDPQAKVTLKGEDLKRFIKRADDSGFSKYMPEFSVIRKVDPKTGYTFSPEQWNALVYGKNGIMAMEDKDLDKREKLARISNYSLQAQKARVELADIQEGKSAEKALVSLQSANWDISKLKPAERAAIQKVAPTMQAKYFDQYNKLLETANKTDDPTQKQALQSQASGLVPTYDFWKGLTSPTAPKVEAGSEKPISPEAKQVVSELKEYPHATYDDIMKDPRLKNVPQQLDALKGANIAVPARGVKHIAEMSKNLGELPDGTKMSRYMTEDEAYEKTVAYLQKQGIAAEGAPMQVVRRGPGF